MPRKTAVSFLFLAVLLIAFWLRIHDLNMIPPGLHRDEGINFVRSWRLAAGYGLTLEFGNIPEPLDAIVRAGFLSVTGVVPFNARLYTIFLNVLGVAAVIAAARALFYPHPYRDGVALAAGVTLAALPPFAMIGRGIYASNWIPFTTMMALAALTWAWRSKRRRDFVLAGIFTALSGMFYLAGLSFPPAAAVIFVLYAIERRVHRKNPTPDPSPYTERGERPRSVGLLWPGINSLLWMGAAALITLLPWLYLFVRAPGWVSERVGQLTIRNFNPLENPGRLLGQFQAAIQPIFLPDAAHDPRYNTYTTAFLNPALAVLFIVGLAVSLWRGRKPAWLAALIVGVVMIMPNVLSNEPSQPIRMVGIYAPLALIVGAGAGVILEIARGSKPPPRVQNPRLSKSVEVAKATESTSLEVSGFSLAAGLKPAAALRWTIRAGLILVFIWTPIYTYTQIRYHFLQQPLVNSNPTSVRSLAAYYRVGYADLLRQIEQSLQPVYVPVDVLDSDLAAALLRPSAFPVVEYHNDFDVPDGEVILPDHSADVVPAPDHTPLQYAFVSSYEGGPREIWLLPPLTVENAQELEARIAAQGQTITNAQGWTLGKALLVTEADNPFSPLSPVVGEGSGVRGETTPLAVFDDRLELLGIDAPSSLTPGQWIPVTLTWRLNQPTGQDYFVRLQAWDYNNLSRGSQNDDTGFIFRWRFPTVMWTPNQIVAETRWLQVYDDAPPGGYRFAISVNTYPGPTPVGALPVDYGLLGQPYDWALLGRSAVSPQNYISAPDANAAPVDAILGDSIKLTGVVFDPPLAALKPGDTLHIGLNWQVVKPVAESYTVFVHLTGADDSQIAQQDAVPFDGQFPTWAWAAGQTVSTEYTLAVPENASGPFTIHAGMYSYPSLQRLPVVQDGQPVAAALVTLK